MGTVSNTLQTAGMVGVQDDSGAATKATMAEILLGANEPDMAGICSGTFGTCTAECTGSEVDAGECPTADVSNPVQANAAGRCNCWEKSHASSAGYWGISGCVDPQPLPNLWNDSFCVKIV